MMNDVNTMFFKNKKVLVAGGTGLIGRPLVEMLIAQGAAVRIASLDDRERAHPHAEFIKTDLLDLRNCIRVCDGMDYVFNLLGVKGYPGLNVTRPASFMYPTIQLAMQMLEAARQCRVEGYLYTSSLAVYDTAERFEEDKVWQTMPAKNDWFAGWSKRIGELQAEAYRIEYEWDRIAVVRPANVYGPYDNFHGLNAMVIPSLIRRALSGEPTLTVWGDGSAVRDFIHADDVARAMLTIAEKMPGKPVNIGSGDGVTIRRLVEIITTNLDHDLEVVWDDSKPTGDSVRVLDTRRAADLGFVPEISLEQGIADVMEWYKRMGRTSGTSRRYDVFANS